MVLFLAHLHHHHFHYLILLTNDHLLTNGTSGKNINISDTLDYSIDQNAFPGDNNVYNVIWDK